MAAASRNISGIKKSMTTPVTVQDQRLDATAILSDLGITELRLSLLWRRGAYNYEPPVTSGILRRSEQRRGEPHTAPLAPPLQFVKYETKVVYLRRTRNLEGALPEDQYMQ
jgi:hypothetical protein